MRKSLLTGIVSVVALTAGAHAGIIYDSTVSSITAGSIFSSNVLDDGRLVSGSGPVTFRAMNFAVQNVDSVAHTVDAVVTFWNTMSLGAGDDTVVNSGSLGSFQYPLGEIAPDYAIHYTSLFNLPSAITVPDSNWGVQIFIVNAGTTTESGTNEVVPLLTYEAPTVGATSEAYWEDAYNPYGSFTGKEQVGANGAAPYVNLYLQLSDTVVPEPMTAAGMMLLTGHILMRRSRRPL